jgi:hypothetical protein
MENLPTDKTYCIMLRGGYKTYINKLQNNQLTEKINVSKFIVIGEKTINSSDIMFILPASEIEYTERVKRGEYKCEYGYWHTKGQECGHMLIK